MHTEETIHVFKVTTGSVISLEIEGELGVSVGEPACTEPFSESTAMLQYNNAMGGKGGKGNINNFNN